jgi:hypothetical protein
VKTRLVLLLALAMSQASCVSIKYSPIHADSPAPPPGSAPLCTEIVSSVAPSLKEGEICIFPIRANQNLTRTPLVINDKQTYRVTVPRNQVWYDSSRRNVAPQGDHGSWLMNLFKHYKQYKQCPESLWFALIATNVDSGSNEQYESFDVSKTPELKITHLGLLAFYPNDAIVPVLGDFYSNNSGQVWVQIEHCAAICMH